MTYDEIMAQIEAGLTGDPHHDISYLKEQCDKYKDDEYGKEILKACGRLIYKAIPDEEKEEFNDAYNSDLSKYEKKLEEIQFVQYQKNFDKALSLMEPLIKDIEEMIANGMFEDDKVSEFFCFDHPLEEVIYKNYNRSEKEVRHCDIPFASIYLQYGSLLIDLDRWEDAQKSLEKAREWNPVSTSIIFELCETYKHLNQLQLYLDTVKEVFQYCYEPETVARAYRNLGWYFVEKEMYDEAVAVLVMSLQYEKNDFVQSELFYIEQKSGKQIAQPEIEDLKKIAEKYGFPVGAHTEVLSILYSIGIDAMKHDNKEVAKYFLNLLFNLTDDEDIKALIDKLE